jgi:hypothetical protein
MNYNTTYICTYFDFFEILKTNNPELHKCKIDEIEYINNISYRNDILNIFELDKFDETKINEYITKLFETIGTNEIIKNCCKILAAQFLCEDLLLGFIILFSYDYLYLTHKCICDILINTTFSEDNLKKLQNIVTFNN